MNYFYMRYSRSGFLNLSMTEIWNWVTLLADWPVHCSMFSNMPGFYLLNVSGPPPTAVTTTSVPGHCQPPLGKAVQSHPR